MLKQYQHIPDSRISKLNVFFRSCGFETITTVLTVLGSLFDSLQDVDCFAQTLHVTLKPFIKTFLHSFEHTLHCFPIASF